MTSGSKQVRQTRDKACSSPLRVTDREKSEGASFMMPCIKEGFILFYFIFCKNDGCNFITESFAVDWWFITYWILWLKCRQCLEWIAEVSKNKRSILGKSADHSFVTKPSQGSVISLFLWGSVFGDGSVMSTHFTKLMSVSAHGSITTDPLKLRRVTHGNGR